MPLSLSSLGRQSSLPDDDEFSSGLLETMRADKGTIPLLPLHLSRFGRCASVDPSLLSLVKTAAENVAGSTEEWPFGARMRFRYGVWRGAIYWDVSAVPLERVSPWDRGVNLIRCETLHQPEVSHSPFTSAGVVETRSSDTPAAVTGCKLLQRSLYDRAAKELPGSLPGRALAEGLLFDCHGHVVETLRCNLLLYRRGRWVTPDLSDCGVRGVMLEWLAGHAEIGEDRLRMEDLQQADELAVCNSVRGVVPVVGLLNSPSQRLQPFAFGPATRALQQSIAEKLW
ncbi:aminotransferase class IV [Microbulbifer harenosus]|uniref:Aminodeoxychorismate lyase n=1 Tax=Microbulbifer harenosus TaxID=2576840 RepID=A0ABY2UFS1_9GAMM|nr:MULTISPECIES: aminotransferase class IV [Microbulbifer]QIL89132.1 hypothetical protein GNX18_04670 [Microbulbifer sp. SH-1]TLM76357.1 hypothetical protein FDY93_13300 [Microbulbifer harenosus]